MLVAGAVAALVCFTVRAVSGDVVPMPTLPFGRIRILSEPFVANPMLFVAGE
jgi:hypothetical protein